ncbi:MAG: GNAT family N-acetyltransferase [Mycoplasma sp.]
MEIKQNLSNKKQEVIKLYTEMFNETEHSANCVISMLDLSKAYAYFDNNEIVSVVCIAEHTMINKDETENSVANICCVMTSSKHSGNHYAIDLIKHVVDQIKDKYDSIVIQSNNWDIYKSLDLVDNTNKKVFEYIEGLYPVPMLIVWNEPEIGIMQEIEMQCTNASNGIKRTPEQIQATIDLYKNIGFKYVANPGAYIWYTEDGKIVELQYSQLSHLTWLFHTINPKGEILLFNDQDIPKVNCLKNLNKEISITKTFKVSKKHITNIKLNDYLV